MTAKLRLAKLDPDSDGVAYETLKPRQRNLGGAIFLVAINDYCGTSAERHETAKQFLYPTDADWRDHFDWVVSLVEGLNPGWLRDVLDRSQRTWDAQRTERLARNPGARKLRMERQIYGRKTGLERVQAAVAVGGDRVAV